MNGSTKAVTSLSAGPWQDKAIIAAITGDRSVLFIDYVLFNLFKNLFPDTDPVALRGEQDIPGAVCVNDNRKS
jgi:hypothetical protein